MTRLELATLVFGSFLVAFVVSMAMPVKAGEVCGRASWYGTESGDTTKSGEHFDGTSLTAAMIGTHHIGERYRVHLGRRHVDVRINDTGGFAKYGRIIDLSKAAARRLGMIETGVATVCLERL